MLTARQYEGIGRLTIAFNEIDEVVKAYLPLVVQYSKSSGPVPQNVLGTFHRRAVAFRKVLESASVINELAGADAGSTLHVLDMAEEIAAKRNEYVHAVAFIDFTTNTRMLQTRSGNAPPDEKQIFDLASKAAFMALILAEKCEALLRLFLEMNQAISEFAVPEEWEEDESTE